MSVPLRLQKKLVGRFLPQVEPVTPPAPFLDLDRDNKQDTYLFSDANTEITIDEDSINIDYLNTPQSPDIVIPRTGDNP